MLDTTFENRFIFNCYVSTFFQLSVDVESINFGAQVIGETIRRSVTLVNKGALGTRFEFCKVPDKPLTSLSVETSLGRLVREKF